METIDLSTFTAEELDSLRQRVINEQERRQDLENLPGEIQQLNERLARAKGPTI